MSDDSHPALSYRFSPTLTPWLIIGWMAAIAGGWLVRYDAWVWPVQFAQLAAATLPTIRIGPHFGELWLGWVWDMVFVVALFAAAFGAGAILVARLTDETGLLAGLFALAIGMWVVAVAVLIVGSVSVAKVRWVLLLLSAWASPVPRQYVRRWQVGKLDGWSKTLVGLMVLAGFVNLLGAVAPPFEYDELVYHLGAPAEYLKAGRIIPLPHNFYSNLPQLTEMLYLLAMAARSDVAAKLLHWSFGILSALAVFAVATRLWSRRVAITSAAMFYCLPFVQDLSQTARIDLATTFFATLAFGGLLVGGEKRHFLWLAALATGCAVATKWPAVAAVLIPAVTFVTVAHKSFRLSSVFCLLSAVLVVPWLVKNWLCSGNPVYPLLNGFFHSPHWSDAQSALFTAKHAPRFDAGELRQLFGLIAQYSFNEPGAVPVLLMTAPLCLLFRNAGPGVRRAAGLLGGAYLGWYLLTFRPWRFLFPVFPLAAMMGAAALDKAGQWSRAVVVATMMVGLAGMGLNVLVDVENLRQVPAQVSFLTYALGQSTREEFIARIGHGMFEPIMWMNRNLPDKAKVLYIGEARAEYARHDVVWATVFDQHPVLHGVAGVTHVYVNFAEWERLRTHYDYLLDFDWQEFRRYLDEHGRVIHETGRAKVYELNP
jgi:hypothetical protein